MSIILSTWFFWCWIIYMLLRFCFLASISQTFNLVFWCLPHIFSQTLASFSCMIASTNFRWLEFLHIVVPSVTRLPVVERPLTMITGGKKVVRVRHHVLFLCFNRTYSPCKHEVMLFDVLATTLHLVFVQHVPLFHHSLLLVFFLV